MPIIYHEDLCTVNIALELELILKAYSSGQCQGKLIGSRVWRLTYYKEKPQASLLCIGSYPA
jgi:hypothetical protein